MAEEEKETAAEETKATPAKKSTTTRKTRTKKTTAKAPEKKPEPVKEEPKEEPFEILVRFTRRNPKFEVIGPSGKRYMFTQQHPYQIVTAKEDASMLLAVEGIELGSPEQVEKFYS